ncbi:MAG: DinB family protein [Bacteroidota bacterium]
MDNKTKNLLKKLESKLDRLHEQLKAIPAEQLAAQPTEEAWSVLNILEHLSLAEYHAHRYLEKKLGFNPELPKVDLSSRFRVIALNAFNRSPFKIKAPKGVDVFQSELPLDAFIEKWKAQRAKLVSFLESLPEEVFDKQAYKHPFGGRLPISGMVAFFDSHFDRHAKQIKRTLRKVGT